MPRTILLAPSLCAVACLLSMRRELMGHDLIVLVDDIVLPPEPPPRIDALIAEKLGLDAMNWPTTVSAPTFAISGPPSNDRPRGRVPQNEPFYRSLPKYRRRR